MLSLTILGTSSAKPIFGREQTSHFLQINNNYFLIDCGENTQSSLKNHSLPYHKLSHIFISHLHGDHYLGLMGLLSTISLEGRENDLTVFGPKGLKEIIQIQLKYSETILNYKLIIRETNTIEHDLMIELKDVIIESIPLVHRVPCCGFIFREKVKPNKLIIDKVPTHYGPEEYKKLKNREHIYNKEGQIECDYTKVTKPSSPPLSYAFCSDTKYTENIIPHIENITLLYHEATFLKGLEKNATKTFHSTTIQAGSIAKKANVKQLIIGHFSARYKDLDEFENETKEIFENTLLAKEGLTITIKD